VISGVPVLLSDVTVKVAVVSVAKIVTVLGTVATVVSELIRVATMPPTGAA